MPSDVLNAPGTLLSDAMAGSQKQARPSNKIRINFFTLLLQFWNDEKYGNLQH
ncbi:hypothetical protein Cabys_2356 [Caldithrix abyssi DSM 13497]|uniref:Uncharacterized protein n=1 Tax=Caldithrix abyssi DSM 13497 TaxID=880073 RepID=A0A1J1C9Y9_CALAY|nr:hypothetical protein Cabys_2356 [Caldithrix abyssi DSM 13497]